MRLQDIPTFKGKDLLDRRINDFARRSFRDIADRDYIAARMAYRAELVPQFLWSSQQAIEKYLKYILLVNRIPAKVGHDIASAMDLTKQLPFTMDIRPRAKQFIEHIAAYGEYRYLDVSYHVFGHSLIDLDMAVWDIRRYSQILDVKGKKLPKQEQVILDAAIREVGESGKKRPHLTRLRGGYLEGILKKPDHPAREPLLWQNAFFGMRDRKTIRLRALGHAENSPLWLYPDMLDELLKYVYVPKELRAAYRQHLAEILADPSKRP